MARTMPSWAWPDLSKVKPRPTSILKFPQRGVGWRIEIMRVSMILYLKVTFSRACLRGGDVEYL